MMTKRLWTLAFYNGIGWPASLSKIAVWSIPYKIPSVNRIDVELVSHYESMSNRVTLTFLYEIDLAAIFDNHTVPLPKRT